MAPRCFINLFAPASERRGHVRAGRFFETYGLNQNDHTLVTRSGIGLGPLDEKDGAELSWINESWNLSASYMHGRFERDERKNDRYRTARVQRIFFDTYSLGASVSQTDEGAQNILKLGLHSVLGFTHSFYGLFEISRTERTGPGFAPLFGLYQFSRFGYEIYKGVHLFGQFQHRRDDFDSDASERNIPGIGFQFFPRPHFEILGTWNKVYERGGGGESDFAYLLFHYYL